jgi:hypothetical protein
MYCCRLVIWWLFPIYIELTVIYMPHHSLLNFVIWGLYGSCLLMVSSFFHNWGALFSIQCNGKLLPKSVFFRHANSWPRQCHGVGDHCPLILIELGWRPELIDFPCLLRSSTVSNSFCILAHGCSMVGEQTSTILYRFFVVPPLAAVSSFESK